VVKKSKKIEINEQFKKAINLMGNTNKSIFITGKAGTGKSTLLNYFCKNTKKRPVVLAPTGVAALNVKGQTIHKFFNFYIDVTPQSIKEKKTRPKKPKFYKKLRTIIIDEVSMLRADLLDCIDIFGIVNLTFQCAKKHLSIFTSASLLNSP
jgi:Cdc6-like AAA superfamily ATPase